MNNPRIHPTVPIDQAAKIYDATTVWINVHIRETANVSKYCHLSTDAYVIVT